MDKSTEDLHSFLQHQHWPLQSACLSSSCSCIPFVVFLRPSQKAMSCRSTFKFIFPCKNQGIINHAEASGLATTKMGTEPKHKDDICCDRVPFGWFPPNFCLGYCCHSMVKAANDHLLPLEESVGHELLGPGRSRGAHDGGHTSSSQGGSTPSSSPE